MMNPFNTGSPLYPFRWYLVYALVIMGIMVYSDLTGYRIFDFSGGQSWSSRGPGYHK